MTAARIVFATAVLSLSACADLGRAPWQNDVQCMRQQMGPGAGWDFQGAASRCAKHTDDGTLDQSQSRLLPLDLHGAPDLQRQAAAIGYPYTQ